MKDWVGFASSLSSDTKVYLALPEGAPLGTRIHMQLQNLGIGLLLVSGSDVKETMPAKDLALQLQLPDLRKEAKRLKRKLGPVYEQFNRNQWRQGFEEACITFETEARGYLWKLLRSGRTIVMEANGKRQKVLTKAQIDKMTMGALAKDFTNLQQQNHADSVIGQTLTHVNPDRILVAHKRLSAAAEKKLRKNVGPQMWRIVAALRELDKAQ
jgi:hypothetical protein